MFGIGHGGLESAVLIGGLASLMIEALVGVVGLAAVWSVWRLRDVTAATRPSAVGQPGQQMAAATIASRNHALANSNAGPR